MPNDLRRGAAGAGAVLLAFLTVCGVLVLALRLAAPRTGPPVVDEPRQGGSAASLLRLDTLLVVGEEAGAASTEFGIVGDVARGPDGQVFVLDVANQHVRVISPDGPALRTLGSKGRGPGEFAGAVALAMDSDGRLFVLDRMNSRIEIFDARSGERTASFRLDLPAEDLCFQSGRLFVLGGNDEHLLHELSPRDGKVLRSFARDTLVRDPLMRTYRASGYLQCGPGDRVSILPLLRPEVTSYSIATGAAMETVTIPGYAAVVVTRDASGGLRFSVPNSQGHDYAGAITAIGELTSLIQVGRIRRGASTPHEFESLRSFVLDWRAGTATPVNPLPRVMYADPAGLIGSADDPFPVVKLLRLNQEEP